MTKVIATYTISRVGACYLPILNKTAIKESKEILSQEELRTFLQQYLSPI